MATVITRRADPATVPGHCGPVRTLLSVIAIFCAPLASAQDWDFEPYIQLVATYTDNLYLAEEGLEVGDWVGQVNPGFSLSRDQGRITTDTQYRLQSLYFADSSDLNTVYNQLRTDSTISVAPERFFIDLDGSIEQAVVDPRVAIPSSNVAATANLGDVTMANVNPYFIQPIGGDTYMRLDYTYGIGRYDNFGLETFSRVDNFQQDIGGFYLGTNELESGLEWSLQYDSQHMDYENVGDYNFERAQVALGIPISRSFRLIATGGRESDLLISRDIGGLDSDFWEVGFRLNPGNSTELEFRTGHRFFGDSFFGSFQLQGRRLGITMTYSENPTTSALGMLDALIIPFNPNANADNTEEPPSLDDIILAPIRAEVYVSKTGRARIDLQNARGRFYLTFFMEDRDFLEPADTLEGSQDGQLAAALGYDRELGPRTTLEMVVRRLQYDYTQTAVQTNVMNYQVGISRQIGRELQLGLSVRHTKQVTDSVARIDNYVENAVDLSLLKTF